MKQVNIKITIILGQVINWMNLLTKCLKDLQKTNLNLLMTKDLAMETLEDYLNFNIVIQVEILIIIKVKRVQYHLNKKDRTV